MTLRQILLLILPFLGVVASCRTTTENEPKSAGAASTDTGVGTDPAGAAPAFLTQPFPGAVAPAPPTPAAAKAPECPVNVVACTQELNRAVCTASLYDGEALRGAARLMAWGSNGCVARQRLARAACDAHLLPSKLGAVACVPDATGGNCPPSPVPCSSGSGKPSLCTGGSYGDQKLTGDLALSASGANECSASAGLAWAACRQNLNPRQLRDVACRPDPTAGECPPKEPPCHELPRGATCSARKLEGKVLTTPLTARAPTACEANLELARLACERQARPSTLDNITCVFAR